MNLASKLEVLPRRLAKQITDAIACADSKLDAMRKLEMLLACVSAIGDAHGSRDVASPRAVTDALNIAQGTLTDVIAHHLVRLPVDDMVSVVPRLSQLLPGNLVVRKAVGVALENAISASSEDRWRAWRDLKLLVSQVSALREYNDFLPLIESTASQIAQLLFNEVRRTPLEQLPESLSQSVQLLETWPAATQEANLLFRDWVPGRLQQLAQNAPKTVSVEWWLDMLRTVAVCGLLERTGLVEICDLLAPVFADAGVRTNSTKSWSSESLGLVVVRQLAGALANNPRGIQLIGRDLFFDCPEDDAAAARRTLASRRSVPIAPLTLSSASVRMARTPSSPDLLVSPSSNRSAGPRSPLASGLSAGRRAQSLTDLSLSPSIGRSDWQRSQRRRPRRGSNSTSSLPSP